MGPAGARRLRRRRRADAGTARLRQADRRGARVSWRACRRRRGSTWRRPGRRWGGRPARCSPRSCRASSPASRGRRRCGGGAARGRGCVRCARRRLPARRQMVVPFDFFGVKSGNETEGHPTLSPAPFTVGGRRGLSRPAGAAADRGAPGRAAADPPRDHAGARRWRWGGRWSTIPRAARQADRHL